MHPRLVSNPRIRSPPDNPPRSLLRRPPGGVKRNPLPRQRYTRRSSTVRLRCGNTVHRGGIRRGRRSSGRGFRGRGRPIPCFPGARNACANMAGPVGCNPASTPGRKQAETAHRKWMPCRAWASRTLSSRFREAVFHDESSTGALPREPASLKGELDPVSGCRGE